MMVKAEGRILTCLRDRPLRELEGEGPPLWQRFELRLSCISRIVKGVESEKEEEGWQGTSSCARMMGEDGGWIGCHDCKDEFLVRPN